eukprot:UN09060
MAVITTIPMSGSNSIVWDTSCSNATWNINDNIDLLIQQQQYLQIEQQQLQQHDILHTQQLDMNKEEKE